MTSRDLQKRQTRQAFFQSVLQLSRSGHAFSSISLRQISREVGVVPTAYCFFFVTLRGETEWVELVEVGWNILIEPFNPEQIASKIIGDLNHKGGSNSDLYGQGDAAVRILQRIITF